MPGRDVRRFSIGLIAFIAPIAMVKAAGFLLGGAAPVGAGAATNQADDLLATVVPAPVPAEWTDPQRAASARAAHLRTREFGSSPFLYPKDAPDVPEIPSDPGLPVAPPPLVQLQGVMGGAKPMAMISGKTYRVGDRLEGEWFITAIDAASRSITITESGSDRTVIISAD